MERGAQYTMVTGPGDSRCDPSPNKGTRKKFAMHFDVKMVDEFRMSKTCNNVTNCSTVTESVMENSHSRLFCQLEACTRGTERKKRS